MSSDKSSWHSNETDSGMNIRLTGIFPQCNNYSISYSEKQPVQTDVMQKVSRAPNQLTALQIITSTIHSMYPTTATWKDNFYCHQEKRFDRRQLLKNIKRVKNINYRDYTNQRFDLSEKMGNSFHWNSPLPGRLTCFKRVFLSKSSLCCSMPVGEALVLALTPMFCCITLALNCVGDVIITGAESLVIAAIPFCFIIPLSSGLTWLKRGQ